MEGRSKSEMAHHHRHLYLIVIMRRSGAQTLIHEAWTFFVEARAAVAVIVLTLRCMIVAIVIVC